MKSLNKFIKILGVAELLGMAFLMAWFWVLAYSNPSKSVVVYINTFGEANIEMFLFMPFILAIGIWAFILIYKENIKW